MGAPQQQCLGQLGRWEQHALVWQQTCADGRRVAGSQLGHQSKSRNGRGGLGAHVRAPHRRGQVLGVRRSSRANNTCDSPPWHARTHSFNNLGQLGQGDNNTLGVKPGQMGDALPFVQLGATAVLIVAGGYHNCALLASGSLKCWGCARPRWLCVWAHTYYTECKNTATASARLGSATLSTTASGLGKWATCCRFSAWAYHKPLTPW